MRTLLIAVILLATFACGKKDKVNPSNPTLPAETYSVMVNNSSWADYDTLISNFYGDSELRLIAKSTTATTRLDLQIVLPEPPANLKANDVLALDDKFYVSYTKPDGSEYYKGGTGTLTITRIDKDEAGNTYYGGTFEVTNVGTAEVGDPSTVSIKGSFYQNFGLPD